MIRLPWDSAKPLQRGPESHEHTATSDSAKRLLKSPAAAVTELFMPESCFGRSNSLSVEDSYTEER